MGKRLQVGIIGQGRSGKNIHADTLSRLPDKFRIAAVADPLEDRRQRAKEEFGCDTYADYREMIERTDLDFVVNTTPSHLHVPVSLELLQKGQHVLCEKPLARTAAEVDRLTDVSRETGKRLYVFQQSRFAPAYKRIRELIDSGTIGRVVRVDIAYNNFARRWDWQTLREFNGGNLYNTGPHPVDQALRFLDADGMPQVMCAMDRANTSGDAEDFVQLMLRASGRPVVNVEISSCCVYPGSTYSIQGTLGGIRGSFTSLEWKYFKPEENEKQELITTPYVDENGMPAYCREELRWHEGSWTFASEDGLGHFDAMCKEYYERLHAHLTAGAPLGVTLEQVRQQIAVMEECVRQNEEALSGSR
ncbi:Gfo/Idh/MocA family protein [Paenibacillus humicola]|uniref:Gfo/Idh/MocA family protein n=1 Tax=Paenibacillus humicola TaxID=3110540 RepID=UPI00237A4599|nr:Gfo/Idh/MocA family oxidoreductase [Paenibacillus humicola]